MNMNAKLKISVLMAAAVVTAVPSSVFAFKISAGSFGQPVHETLTLQAALNSGLLQQSQTEELQYLVEGARFNDDPEGYLMAGVKPSGADGALNFALEFIGLNAAKKKDDPTKASHYGDYQFLHAMGKTGDAAQDIKGRILLYAMFCWRAFSDSNSLQNVTNDYAVVTTQMKSPKANFKYSKNQLILKDAIANFPKEVIFFHAKNQKQYQYRALGSLLHLIQDSYVKSHVVRTGWYSGDNSGDILYFQSYSDQSLHEHDRYDSHAGTLTNNNVFEIPGALAAYDRSSQLMTLAKQNCPWTKGQEVEKSSCQLNSIYEFLSKVIFALDPNMPAADHNTRSHKDLLKNDPNNIYSGG